MPQNRLLCVHRGADDTTTMYWCVGTVQPDGSLQWSGDHEVGFRGQAWCFSDEGAALASFQGKIICVFSSVNDGILQYTIWNKDQGFWYPPMGMARSCAGQPAMLVHNDTLYCMYISNQTGTLAWIRCSGFQPNPQPPSPGILQPPETPIWSEAFDGGRNEALAGVALTIFGDKLHCIHRGGHGDTQGYWSRLDGTQWTKDNYLQSIGSNAVIGAVGYNGKLICAFSGTRNIETIGTSYFEAGGAYGFLNKTPDGVYWSGNNSYTGPALVTCAGNLYCVHRGGGDQLLRWTRWRTDNNTWLSDTPFPGNQSRTEVAVIAVGDEF